MSWVTLESVTLPPWPLRRVLVVGPSMVPTLRHGDHIVVARWWRIRPGDVVIGAFVSAPDRLVVKRAVRVLPEGAWWLEGDSLVASDDSRTYGPAVVHGRVLGRYYPRPRWLRRDPAGPAQEA